MELVRYFGVLWKRKWTILLTAVIATAVVGFVMIKSPSIYTATAKLRVVPFSINAPDYGTYVYFDRLANTYSEILKSNTVIEETKKRLSIDNLPDFKIETIPQTELMRITVDDRVPQSAADVANALAAILIEQNQALSKTDGGVQSTLSQRLTALENEINQLITERLALLDQIPRDAERIAELDQKINSRQQIYSLTLQSYNQAIVSQSTMANALSIVEEAVIPVDASSPARLRNTVIGGLVGLIGGIALAFVLEIADTRLYTYKQLLSIINLPILGKIPHLDRDEIWNVFTKEGVAAESFRQLRATIFAASKGKPKHLLLVTSAVAGEGKSTVAANLARAMARSGMSVVLVDCDLRLPTLHKFFNFPSTFGLSSVLEDPNTLDVSLIDTNIERLKVLPTGPTIPEATEALGSPIMSALINELMQRFDVVLLDAPPVLAATDAAVLAPCADGTLMVVDFGRSDERSVLAAHDALVTANANILGLVVNRAPWDSSFSQVKNYAQRHP